MDISADELFSPEPESGLLGILMTFIHLFYFIGFVMQVIVIFEIFNSN